VQTLFFNPENENDMKTIKRNTKSKTFLLIKAILAAFFVAAFNQSCTNLDEELYSEVTPDNFFKTEEEFIAALGNAYTQLGNYASGDVTNLQECTTDEEVVPTRGSDWDDGGNWRRLHLHSWKFEDGATGGAWDFCFSGVTTANQLIYQFETLASNGQIDEAVAAAYVAELRTLRGFFYWQLLDLYGNVPLVTDFANADPEPPTKSRQEVYDWLVGELEESVPLLSKAVDGTTYGRMNYYAGMTLLAKIYLNSGVYVNTPKWSQAIAACDEIINSGKYDLEPNYFTNFNVDNAGSSEFIFAIPYDAVFFQGFQLPMQTLHYTSQFTYDLTEQPWNGFCSLEEFYNSYSDEDLRKGDPGTLEGPAGRRGNFLAGYQYTSGGIMAQDGSADGADPDGAPLNFGNLFSGLPQINELGPQAWRQSGVRIGKWEFTMGGTRNMSNDFAVFRYADVMLMKAEALWRVSNDAADAASLALVNQIRGRAKVPDLTTLDGPLSFAIEDGDVPGGELFNEMGREMVFEHNRRQDLIRWGFWNDNAKWTLPYNNPGDVLKSGDYLKIFPINRDKLSANKNLVQNPGY
jgi:starch-binding outer membrane protein, SusD/RagB family